VEYEVRDILCKPERSGVANPDAKPPELWGAEGAGNVSNAIVAPMATALFEADGARGKIELIMHHQDGLCGNLIEAGGCTHGTAGVIHKRLGLE
jgi:hypothetical protein